jgi:glycosyltransferase involved in cell wall biosynthesis
MVDGGVAIASGRLAETLVRRGHCVTVVTMRPEASDLPPGVTLQAPAGVQMHYGLSPDPLRQTSAVAVLREWMQAQHQRQPFDVLLAYFIYPGGYLACVLGEQLHVPVVCSCRGNDVTKDMFMTPQTIAFVLERSTHLIFVSASLLHMAHTLVACQHKATVVANAVDSRLFVPRSGPRRPGPVVLGSSGVLRWKKGIDLLLPLIQRLSTRYGIRVCLAGYGLDAAITQQLMTFLAQHDLQEQVEITGPLPHTRMLEALQRMDIYLSTSYQEGMPNGVLEAMACGLPVIATAADGTIELVQDGVTGYLCPLGNLECLYERCCWLIEQPAWRQQLGQAGRRRIEQHFQLEHEVAAVEAILMAVVQA